MATVYEAFNQRLLRPRVANVAGDSDQRLSVMPGAWGPSLFSDAARAFTTEAGLATRIVRKGGKLPPLSPETRFRYTASYDADRFAWDNNLVVSVVMEGKRVIGWGILSRNDEADLEIEIVDVDVHSRRCHGGFQKTLVVGNSNFGVGVAHVIVDQIISAVGRPIQVEATNAASRYVFRSLGFQGNGDRRRLE